MRKLLTVCVLFFIAVGHFCASAEVANWNRNWEFQLGDVGADAPEGWQKCFLPHSFSAPYFLGEKFYTGEGWYRKKITPEDYKGAKNVFLDFEGVFQFAEIFVDGTRVGGHRSGYTGFRVDLTPALDPSRKSQTVAVRVSNRWDSRTAPRAGEHIFTGGINRDVRLVTAGSVYIERNGVTVVTPKVSAASAGLDVSVRVRNSNTKDLPAFCRMRLTSPDGKRVVAEKQMSISAVQARGEKDVVFRSRVSNPKLWSPEEPNLYRLEVELWSGRKAPPDKTDASKKSFSGYACNVGFRWFEFTADKGFFLNGKHVFLMGANVHQDSAGWGDGVTNGSHDRDVKMMKETGFNFIRGSHYPHDPAFVDACDRHGMLFWSEGGIWGMGGQKVGTEQWNDPAIPHKPEDRMPFAQSAETLVREMIRDVKNHPSIIAWSVCNEPFFVPGDLIRPSKELTAQLLRAVKEEDPTRPAALGGVQRSDFDKIEEADIVGYNGDGARIFKNPSKPSIVAEYGSTVCHRPGPFSPGWGDFENERPAWRAGAAIWCGFDHGSIWETGSRMGIIDYFRIPKRSWHWYRESQLGIKPPEWPQNGTPAKLQLTSDKTELTSCAGEDDALLTVKVLDKKGKHISNSVPVTLRIVSGPGEFPTGKTITFRPNSDIDIREGIAAIAFRSNFNGTTRIIAEASGLKSSSIRIRTNDTETPDSDKEFVSGRSVETPDRPYTGRYSPSADEIAKRSKAVVSEANLAENRPCRASSNDLEARFAADGNEASSWKASKNDTSPTWTLDMEFLFKLNAAEIFFLSGEAPKDFYFEISSDGKTWKKLVPTGTVPDANDKSKMKFTFGEDISAAKYFRIRFVRSPEVGLREVILRGAS